MSASGFSAVSVGAGIASESDISSTVVENSSKDVLPIPKSSTTLATTLVRAAGEGKLEVVNRILDNTSAKVATLTARGTTALHEASKGGHMDVVVELLRRDAEVNCRNRSGCIPLHFGALCKNKDKSIDVVKLLLDARSSVNCSSERMDTPLHFASYCMPSKDLGSPSEVIQLLVKMNAKVNARNRNGETPLINGTLNDNLEVVKTLLNLGASQVERNYMDKNAHDVANERGCQPVINAFEEMKDPSAKFADVSNQIRTVLDQMQSLDNVTREHQKEHVLHEAYAGISTSVISMLGRGGCAVVVTNVLGSLQELDQELYSTYGRGVPTAVGSYGSSSTSSTLIPDACTPYPPCSLPAWSPVPEHPGKSCSRGTSGTSASTIMSTASPINAVLPSAVSMGFDSIQKDQQKGRLLQAVLTLIMLARNPDGHDVLHEVGASEVIQGVERYIGILKVCSQELRELRDLLQRPQVEERLVREAESLSQDAHDRSSCSTPTFMNDASLRRRRVLPMYSPPVSNSGLASAYAAACNLVQDCTKKDGNDDRFALPS